MWGSKECGGAVHSQYVRLAFYCLEAFFGTGLHLAVAVDAAAGCALGRGKWLFPTLFLV